jgi:D-arabinose 1-dehydrogenase-like Zn-dependent alcohol dehydrogenase
MVFYVFSFTALDMICRHGGFIGTITNGGFAGYAAFPENVLRYLMI